VNYCYNIICHSLLFNMCHGLLFNMCHSLLFNMSRFAVQHVSRSTVQHFTVYCSTCVTVCCSTCHDLLFNMCHGLLFNMSRSTVQHVSRSTVQHVSRFAVQLRSSGGLVTKGWLSTLDYLPLTLYSIDPLMCRGCFQTSQLQRCSICSGSSQIEWVAAAISSC